MTVAPVAGQSRRLVFRIARLLIAGTAIGAIVLALHASPPPRRAPIDPQSARRLETKVSTFLSDAQRGLKPSAHLSQEELNAWIGERLAARAPRPGGSGAEHIASPGAPPVIAASASDVRDVTIELSGDVATAHFMLDLYGKDVSVTLSGRPRVDGGVLTIAPTALSVGSLPLPKAAVDQAVDRWLGSPGNRDRLRLPPEIGSLRVENGEVVVSAR